MAAEPALHAEGQLRRWAAREVRRMISRDLLGDLGSAVSDTHDQHSAVAKLAEAPVVAGVQLHTTGVQLAREYGHARFLIRRHRDDDLLGLETIATGRDQVPIANATHAI